MRLVRKICPKCKQVAELPAPMLAEIEKDLSNFNLPKPFKFYEGAGCNSCTNGFSGRIGLFEILEMTSELSDIILKEPTESKIKEENIFIIIQINGRVRAQFEAEAGTKEAKAKEEAFSLPEVQKWLVGKEIKKVIFVPNKIINFVVEI